jgi:hypothetical protein
MPTMTSISTLSPTCQVQRCRLLEMPTKLRLIAYGLCATITMRRHPIILELEAEKIDFDIILKSTGVALLSTCRLINGESECFLKRAMVDIISAPARMIFNSYWILHTY